jgi:DNA polymerase III alpha subunit
MDGQGQDWPSQKWQLFPLNCKSYYSFCDSLLAPDHIVALAVQAGATAVTLTDPNPHGAAPFYQAAVAAWIKPIHRTGN